MNCTLRNKGACLNYPRLNISQNWEMWPIRPYLI